MTVIVQDLAPEEDELKQQSAVRKAEVRSVISRLEESDLVAEQRRLEVQAAKQVKQQVCTRCTMRFWSTAKVPAKCKLKYCRISECGIPPAAWAQSPYTQQGPLLYQTHARLVALPDPRLCIAKPADA